jgi:hypothetical protein
MPIDLMGLAPAARWPPPERRLNPPAGRACSAAESGRAALRTRVGPGAPIGKAPPCARLWAA